MLPVKLQDRPIYDVHIDPEPDVIGLGYATIRTRFGVGSMQEIMFVAAAENALKGAETSDLPDELRSIMSPLSFAGNVHVRLGRWDREDRYEDQATTKLNADNNGVAQLTLCEFVVNGPEAGLILLDEDRMQAFLTEVADRAMAVLEASGFDVSAVEVKNFDQFAEAQRQSLIAVEEALERSGEYDLGGVIAALEAELRGDEPILGEPDPLITEGEATELESLFALDFVESFDDPDGPIYDGPDDDGAVYDGE